MTPVPFDLPLRPDEAGELANVVFEHAEGRPLTDDLRNRLATRAAGLKLETVKPYLGSVERDPVHRSTYYVAVDGERGSGWLLRLALASSPASALFPKAFLIGRMRRPGGPEIVVNASPFSPDDRDNVRRFATEVNQAFLPRPQGAQPAISAGNRMPSISLPAAFDAYRVAIKRTGRNIASTVQLSAGSESAPEGAIAARDGENPTAPGHTRISLDGLYHWGLWAAIRAGWREGYNAGADGIAVSGGDDAEVGRSLEAAQEVIREAAAFTKFGTDASALVELRADPRHPESWSDSAIEEKFEKLLDSDDRGWVVDEFSRLAVGELTYEFTAAEARRLAVKYGAALVRSEELYDAIRQARSGQKLGRSFDFEPVLDRGATLTTSRELVFCLHWLKARGRAAQLACPNLGFRHRRPYPESLQSLQAEAEGWALRDLRETVERDFDGRPLEELSVRLTEIAAVVRHFQATLSVHRGSGKQEAVLEAIARAAAGRVNYKISGELQLQALDVLAGQPEGSPWRELYGRMVRRASAFAAGGAFGPAGDPAGCGTSLGDPEDGRAGGNPFLIARLGHVAGSRDVEAPDRDCRFFQEKLAELPEELAAEARRRNARYIGWLAQRLLG